MKRRWKLTVTVDLNLAEVENGVGRLELNDDISVRQFDLDFDLDIHRIRTTTCTMTYLTALCPWPRPWFWPWPRSDPEFWPWLSTPTLTVTLTLTLTLTGIRTRPVRWHICTAFWPGTWPWIWPWPWFWLWRWSDPNYNLTLNYNLDLDLDLDRDPDADLYDDISVRQFYFFAPHVDSPPVGDGSRIAIAAVVVVRCRRHIVRRLVGQAHNKRVRARTCSTTNLLSSLELRRFIGFSAEFHYTDTDRTGLDRVGPDQTSPRTCRRPARTQRNSSETRVSDKVWSGPPSGIQTLSIYYHRFIMVLHISPTHHSMISSSVASVHTLVDKSTNCINVIRLLNKKLSCRRGSARRDV